MRIDLLLSSLTAMSLPADADVQAPPSADGFEREVLKSLKASHAGRRGVILHVNGATVSGLVTAIGHDAVVLTSRERARIIVRRERIDAVEADA